MKVVQINTFSNKSTGTIMLDIHEALKKNNIESYVVWGRGRKARDEGEIYLNDKFGIYCHGLYTRFTDKTGFASKKSTQKLIERLEKIKPDIIHLHNIHGYYINIEILFNYIRKNNIKTIWTLHDCWAFTGHCSHFELVGCEKWKECCDNCEQKEKYPKSFVDNSKWNYQRKKELFDGLNITIVTPSKWLADLVKQSYLKQYEVKVVNNGIDTDIFKPRKSDFKKKFNIENKKVILGVASDWTKEKGLYDFYDLSEKIDDDVKIVLVGLNSKQMKEIPENIIGIERTENAQQLAEIYTAADIYFNPTYADNFPTTNLEALACETPVFTYNTGGSIECLDGNNGAITNLKDFSENYRKYLEQKFEINKVKTKLEMESDYINIYNNL